MSKHDLTQVGKYLIVELIGEGAMGVVYRAQDPVLSRPVAIKVMTEAIAREPELRERFLREAQAAGSLQHPNLITIYDFGEVDGHPFIAMEFVSGVDLEAILARHEPLTLRAKLDVAIDVLSGLGYAHKRGVIHRDIKPANIRITEEARAKIMDFGIAHLSTSNMTKTGVMFGTPNYMAPEQVMGEKTSPETDIFAVGAVLYEMLTGAKPFQGPTLQSVMYRIVSEDPPPVREVVPGLPAALDRVVRKALAKKPEERYASALDMANELSTIRASLTGDPHSGTLSLRKSIESTIAAQHMEPRFGRKAMWGAGIAAAMVLAAGGVWLARGRAAHTESASVATTGPSAPVAATPAPPPVPNDAPPPAAGRAKSPSPAATPATGPATSNATSPLAPESTKARTNPRLQPPTKLRVEPPVPPLRQPLQMPAPTRPDTPPPAASSVVRAPMPAPSPAPAAQPAANPAQEIAAVIAAYARAIGTRDIAEVRRAYPGVTAEQQRGFEQFFRSVRSLRADFAVTGSDVTGSSAEAQVRGAYEFVDADGKSERQPITFGATLKRDGSVWRLMAVR